MSNQKHSVATDALETLGTFPIPDTSGRDAIHLAVEPVIAGEILYPGYRIVLRDGKAYREGFDDTATGIVDPFIVGRIATGERFWFVVLPRTITSLRHVWSHPAFPEEKLEAYHADADEHYVTSPSRKWIEDFAAQIDQTYNRLMEAAADWLRSKRSGGWGDYTYDNSEAYKGHWDQFPEFWKHYEVVTGEKVEEDHRESFFTCSC